MTSIRFAQITDSHLFASKRSLHHGCNVFENLQNVLNTLNNDPAIQFIVFTGDLTQDHSEASYQNFVDCVHACKVTVPIYFLAGNHDEPELLAKYFNLPPFITSTSIKLAQWEVQLLNSKSDTPAGYVSSQELKRMHSNMDNDKYQFLMMHHHPIDVGYFIDKHGLKNKTEFWLAINQHNNIKGIACGHVHGAQKLIYPEQIQINNGASTSSKIKKGVPLYTCPATSIQFDPNSEKVSALPLGPGYRTFDLLATGEIKTQVHRL